MFQVLKQISRQIQGKTNDYKTEMISLGFS